MAVVGSRFILTTLALWCSTGSATSSAASASSNSASSTSSGLKASLCTTFSKMLPGVCGDSEQAKDPCKDNPSSCCQDSTCASMPGMGCWSKRGKTQCVGNNAFTFSMGKCQCISGYCNTDGVCAESSVAESAATSAATGFQASFGRLYEKSSRRLPPEDHTAALLAYSISFGGFALLAVVSGKRLRQRREGDARAAARLVSDED
eukprot:TRINITY_DN13308_c0_g1_i1.p1 TRINITY_DN13308_c0_g1~~TRINITY_DN13308_c0_g1_i1.p1  ORF type:complete len:205 (-),score=33.73 TRINITY_DN13308_c0_g1_i1:125-739(-)